LGLGRALLDEIICRFKTCGADAAFVETESTRLPAQRAYESAGFQRRHEILRKGRFVKTTEPT
jgi:ribosomal protein S18 acetylase RimI-like enzyme